MPEFAKQLYQERPQEIALRFEDKTMNWSDIDITLNKIANGLNKLDLGSQRRIAVFAENALETAMANLGGLIAGASVVPVNFHLTSEEVAYILEDAGVSVLFVGPETIDRGLKAAEIAGTQFKVKQQIEASHKKLYDRKIGSQLSYLQSRDASLAAQREYASAKNSIDNLLVKKMSTIADRKAFHAQWASTLAKELGSNQEVKAELSEEQVKLDRQVSNLDVRSPVDGIVLDLPKVTAGSIVSEGETLFTLVRTNVPLELEIDIDPKDVSDLKLQAPVSVKLDALPYQQYGDLKGELVFVSDDTFDNSLSGEPGAWYRGRVKIFDSSLKDLPDEVDLTPGMLASADLLVGERRLVTYFTYPITRNIRQAFHEPD